MLVSRMNFQRKCDKKRLVMYVNAPSENHFERYGVYVSIRNLYLRPCKRERERERESERERVTFSTVDYGGNNSASFFSSANGGHHRGK